MKNGICGDALTFPSPGQPQRALICELEAGHLGWHEADVYEPTFSAPNKARWSTSQTATKETPNA